LKAGVESLYPAPVKFKR